MTHSGVKNVAVVAMVIGLVAVVALLREGRATPAAEEGGPTTTSPAVASAPSRLPRMVDLGADKCIPCKRMAPILAELKTEYAGRAEIEFIDVWKNPDAGQAHGVRAIPTQVFYDRAGEEVWRHEGFLDKPEIVAKLKELGAV